MRKRELQIDFHYVRGRKERRKEGWRGAAISNALEGEGRRLVRADNAITPAVRASVRARRVAVQGGAELLTHLGANTANPGGFLNPGRSPNC